MFAGAARAGIVHAGSTSTYPHETKTAPGLVMRLASVTASLDDCGIGGEVPSLLASGAPWADGDVNMDGDINLVDLAILLGAHHMPGS